MNRMSKNTTYQFGEEGRLNSWETLYLDRASQVSRVQWQETQPLLAWHYALIRVPQGLSRGLFPKELTGAFHRRIREVVGIAR